MADTSFGTNHANTVMYWHRKLFREALKQCQFYKFMGDGSDSIIQFLNETQKGPGDRIRVILRQQLTGTGVNGDGTLEGNEEELATYTDNLIIDQHRHAVRSGGQMSDQRIPFSVREEAYMGLRDYWSEILDCWLANQLTGNTLGTVPTANVAFTGMQVALAPSTNNWLFAGPGDSASEASVTNSASGVFRLTEVDRMVVRAKTLETNPIRSIKMDGVDKYVVFIHPFQHHQLRQNTNAGQYNDIAKAAIQGGQISKNPLFTGSLGEWNGAIMHESYRIPWGNATSGKQARTALNLANRARAVLCGAQACLFGTGQNTSKGGQPNWYEELFDYGNKLGVSAGMIAGAKKSVFNAADFGTIVMSSFSADPG